MPSKVICLLIPFSASSSRLRLTLATYLMDTYRHTDMQTHAVVEKMIYVCVQQ